MQLRERLGVTSEPQREGLVVCERRRHQITKSERAQQAPSHPAGERIAGAGQNRQPRPQRVACGRMGVAGEGVQEKISETIPGEMLGQGQPGGENEARRCDAARRGLAREVGSHPLIRTQEPEHAPRYCVQQPHPHVEERRGELVAVIEAAEDEAFFGQAAFAARRGFLGDRPLAVVALIAVRQVHQPLAEKALLIRGHDKLIYNNIVDEICTHRARISEVIDLNRCGSVGGDLRPAVRLEANQVDQYIDRVGVDQLRDGQILHF